MVWPQTIGRVGADRRAAPDEGRAELVLALDLGARIVDVGEHAGRPAEHTLLERDALVEADVVLDLAAVADNDVGADHDVLPDGHVAPDPYAARMWLKCQIFVPSPISTGRST